MMSSPAAANRLDPFPWYAQMRASQPVAFNPERFGWHVFRYADVQRVLSEWQTFSSQYPGQTRTADRPLESSIISTDPPRHRQLRALVTQAFTPRTVARLEPRIRAIVDELLDAAVPHGKMDLIDDLAYPLPVIVIAELLGVPRSDRAQFKQWSDAVVGSARAAGMAGRNPQAEMSEYFGRLIADRRREPQDDLISALLAAQIEGEHLSTAELLGFCVLLLVAGNETTTNLLGNAMLCFDENRGVLAQLRRQPELIPSTIEEVLRYRSPVQAMFRFTAQPAEVSGVALPAGMPVVAWIGSANRDDEQFPDAGRFTTDRAPNRHLAFGHGIHFCLGAPLARLEARVALEELSVRIDEPRIAPGTRLEPLESFIVYGVQHLPLEFQPRALNASA